MCNWYRHLCISATRSSVFTLYHARNCRRWRCKEEVVYEGFSASTPFSESFAAAVRTNCDIAIMSHTAATGSEVVRYWEIISRLMCRSKPNCQARSLNTWRASNYVILSQFDSFDLAINSLWSWYAPRDVNTKKNN